MPTFPGRFMGLAASTEIVPGFLEQLAHLCLGFTRRKVSHTGNITQSLPFKRGETYGKRHNVIKLELRAAGCSIITRSRRRFGNRLPWEISVRWPHLIEGKLVNGYRHFSLLRNEAWLNPLTMNTSHCAIAQPDPILLEQADLPHDFNPVPPRHEPEPQDELPFCA